MSGSDGRDQPPARAAQVLGWLDAYLLLPKLNCRECGLPTCVAFAFGLLTQERRLEECPRLAEAPYSEGGQRLRELLT